MNKIKKISTCLSMLLCIGLLAGCTTPTLTQESTSTPQGITTPADTVSVTPISSTSDVEIQNITYKASADDYYFDWKSGDYTTIDLENGSSSITKSGIYELTGALSEGSLTVDVDKTVDTGTVFLVFNGIQINSTTGTPLYIVNAQKVVILLENTTSNTVTQGSITTTEEAFPSAAIYSKADMTITGGGTLSVTTLYNDGIASKDDLIITDGIFTIDAVGDGIAGKDVLAVENATIQIKAGKDGMRSTNSTDDGKGNLIIESGTFTIDAANDSIQAEKVLQIKDGTFTLSSGGGYPGQSIKASEQFGRPAATQTASTTTESQKTLKAGTAVIIASGTFSLSAYQDAIHSNGSVTIDGGKFTINAGDDGIHADNAIAIKGGDIQIANAYEGIEGENITVSSGKISILSSDDGMNVSSSSGAMTISGGEISIESIGDGMDSNGNFIVSGGSITINTSTISRDNSTLDYDGVLTFTGGTIVDQSGTTIDPTVRTGPGGMGGGGMDPGNGNRIKPPQNP